MDMRYLRYVSHNEKYYIPSTDKANESMLIAPDLPDLWSKKSDDHWTYCFKKNVTLPIQGWKIHVTTNINEAQHTLDLIAPFLIGQDIPFKYVSSIWELTLTNSKYGDRGSSGKFITVYPKDETQFIFLLDELDDLTKKIPKGPYILSDKRWKDGNIYFRYGAFVEMYVYDGAAKIPAIKDLSGKYIPDSRGPFYVIPTFIGEPKEIQNMDKEREEENIIYSPINDYKIKSALHFSNGGGVYLAEHLKSKKQVVLKEGRPGAGLDAQGRDAVKRIEHEIEMLKKLSGLDCIVEYYNTIKAWEHTFLVEEYIPGTALNTWLAAYYPFSKYQDAIGYCEKMVPILKQLKQALIAIHSRGIGMGDLQPANVIVDTSNKVKLIDFESASDIHDTQQSGLVTPGFVSPMAKTREQADWFALLRIARYVFLPIGPVQDLAESILKKHDKWISKNFGKKAINIIEEIELECKKHLIDSRNSMLSSSENYLYRNDLPYIISTLRQGIVNEIKEGKQLLPGDIRQYESSGGMFNVLTGGFGIIMSLSRTGTLPKKAKDWALKYSDDKYISNLNNGLFTGKSGIAGVLYEIGLEERSKALYDSIPINIDTEDISLLSGLSGIGLALLTASSLPGLDYLLAKSLSIAEQLEQLLYRNINIKSSDLDFIPIGLIDGWSGVSLFFSSLYKSTKNTKWLDLSVKAIEKDLSQCVYEDSGLYQVKDNSRFVPYLAGGSAGVGIAMLELRSLLKKDIWNKELFGIGNLAKSKCFYSGGLFRGLSGLIVFANAIDSTFKLKNSESFLDKALETLNLYLLEDGRNSFFPGDYCYRVSGDIFSGSSGVLLALSDVNTNNWCSWIPIVNIDNLSVPLNRDYKLLNNY